MTIRELVDTCVDITPETEFMVYETLGDFHLGTSRWTGYNEYNEMPDSVRGIVVAKFSISHRCNVVVIAARS